MLDHLAQQEPSMHAARPTVEAALDAGPIHMDLRTFSASIRGGPLALTRLEFDLLAYLIRNSDRVVSPPELMDRVVHGVYRKESSVIRVHVAHLRKKLGHDASMIETMRGRGVRLRLDGSDRR